MSLETIHRNWFHEHFFELIFFFILRTLDVFSAFKFVVISFVLVLIVSCHSVNEPVFGGTVTDVDGNVYHTVTIGTQTWMIENLKTTRLNDSTAIPLVTDSAAWANQIASGYCWYNNNDTIAKANNYGALYNWYSVYTAKLAPKGWHIPTADEWAILEKNVTDYYYLSGSLAKVLAATTHWTSTTSSSTIGSNLAKNNSSGFTALPGGYRLSPTSAFKMINLQGAWWSSSQYNDSTAWNLALTYNQTTVDRSYKSIKSGYSVRCIKDTR